MGYIDNILKQPLPFYTSEAQQAFSNKIYAGQRNLIHNVCSTFRLIPFTLTRTESAAVLTHVYLVNHLGTETDIITHIPTGQIPVYTTDSNVDYICYFGNANMTTEMTAGTYHLKITDGTNTWYSDKFKIETWPSNLTASDGTKYIEFEYYNAFDAWGFIYQGGSQIGFKNRLRLKTRPYSSREFEEYKEVDQDRYLDEVTTYQKNSKLYGCKAAALWDYTTDALNLMRLHTNITVKFGMDENEVIEVKPIIPESLEQTDYATAEIKWRLRNFIFEPTANLSIEAVNNATFYLLYRDGVSRIIKRDGGKIIKRA
jgi:hypothetical protein